MQITNGGGWWNNFGLRSSLPQKTALGECKSNPQNVCACMYMCLYKPVERLIYFWWEYKLETSKNPECLT